MPGAGGQAPVDDSVKRRAARFVFLVGKFRIAFRLGRESARGQGSGAGKWNLACRPGAAGGNGNRGNDEEAREKREGGQRRHESTMHRNLTQELRQRSGRRHQGSAHARPSSREATNHRTRAKSDRLGLGDVGPDPAKMGAVGARGFPAGECTPRGPGIKAVGALVHHAPMGPNGVAQPHRLSSPDRSRRRSSGTPRRGARGPGRRTAAP